MPHSIMRVDVAGRDVTRYLRLLLRKEGVNFRTTAEFEIVRTIKVTSESSVAETNRVAFSGHLDEPLFWVRIRSKTSWILIRVEDVDPGGKKTNKIGSCTEY